MFNAMTMPLRERVGVMPRLIRKSESHPANGGKEKAAIHGTR